MTLGSKTAFINGHAKQLIVALKITNNSIYVPLRFIGEALGRNVSWDYMSSSVNIGRVRV
ncbi:copper amine oxidase N-terminal domain-containing protein [Paenibacillus lignilyticus]|uniref:Copper amine oxidase N-terminal domain-containing protein n=1 Tax=Paenibacillus lignilyticus TaxID=1172615 RepID=A0ABS5CMR8_9BACL|nr:copper amine oxidase N-terminal domain-containing protein [Paenibacillus lignilyticus]